MSFEKKFFVDAETLAILKESNQQIQLNARDNGCSFFIKWLYDNPPLKNVFPKMRKLDDLTLATAGELRRHIALFMRGVDEIIIGFENPQKLDKVMAEIQSAHRLYSVRKEYLLAMRPYFIGMVKRACAGGRWSEKELEKAWNEFFEAFYKHFN